MLKSDAFFYRKLTFLAEASCLSPAQPLSKRTIGSTTFPKTETTKAWIQWVNDEEATGAVQDVYETWKKKTLVASRSQIS